MHEWEGPWGILFRPPYTTPHADQEDFSLSFGFHFSEAREQAFHLKQLRSCKKIEGRLHPARSVRGSARSTREERALRARF